MFEPDLVAVTAVNGRGGYAYRADLEDGPLEMTSSSELAVDPGDYQEPKAITAYESDGRTPVGSFVSFVPGTSAKASRAHGAPSAKWAHAAATRAFRGFLHGKRGYCLITKLGGSGQPVMFWSKHRLSGYTANITNSAKLYVYEKGG